MDHLPPSVWEELDDLRTAVRWLIRGQVVLALALILVAVAFLI